MSLKLITPCDFHGLCPFSAGSCEYWCGADEPEDIPEIEEDIFEIEDK